MRGTSQPALAHARRRPRLAGTVQAQARQSQQQRQGPARTQSRAARATRASQPPSPAHQLCRRGSRLYQSRTRSRPVPVTELVRKMGASASACMWRLAVTTSSSERTRKGRLLHAWGRWRRQGGGREQGSRAARSPRIAHQNGARQQGGGERRRRGSEAAGRGPTATSDFRLHSTERRPPALAGAGTHRTPGLRRMAPSVVSVCLSTCSGARSTLVTTKKTGTC